MENSHCRAGHEHSAAILASLIKMTKSATDGLRQWAMLSVMISLAAPLTFKSSVNRGYKRYVREGRAMRRSDLPTRTEGFLWLLRTNLTENDGVLFIQRIPAGSHLFHDHPLHAVAALAELRELFDQPD